MSLRPLKPVGRISAPRRARRSVRYGGGGPALMALLLLGIGGGGAWWMMQQPKSLQTMATAAATDAAEPRKTAGDAAGGGVEDDSEAKLSAILSQPSKILVRPTAPKTSAATPETLELVDAFAEEKEFSGDSEMPAVKVDAEPQADFGKLLVLEMPAASQEVNVEARKKALDLAFSTGGWDHYRQYLGRSLRAWLDLRFKGTETDVLAPLFENPYTSEVLLQHAFLTAAGQGIPDFLKKNEAGPPFLRWVFSNQDAMRSFAQTISREDNVPEVFRIWSGITNEEPSATTTYLQLGLACALVFDELKSVRWNDRKLEMNYMDRFRFYRENADAGRLTGKIRLMSAADLMWVVCAPVPQSELEWALKKADWRQKSWGDAYDFIKYDMEKAVNGVSKDPYDSYTFEEIKKKGGICSDRSYFSANTARAHGIPAAVLGGDGPRGGHAWITWLAEEGEWKFAGRLGGYPSGHCGNPQTGEETSEDDFMRANDRRAAGPTRVLKARQWLWLANLYGADPEKADALIAAARKAAPNLPLVAEAELLLWINRRQDSPVDDWKKFIAALRKEFRDNSGLMAMVRKAEETYIFARQDTKDSLHTLRREATKIAKTKGADAGIAPDIKNLAEAFRRQAELLVTANDLDGVRGIYRRAFSEYGDDPALFKALANDLFDLVEKDKTIAAKACRDLENSCRRYVGRGGGDWFDVTSQNTAWQLVATCYRKCGQEKKAITIERQLEQRKNAAKRQAV
ncbi:MAG: hypothetical protein JWM59_2877 [Verrucomicrobiales bacterium]|nr:hypothetical protein [Verrucomicrobiales bacterium]